MAYFNLDDYEIEFDSNGKGTFTKKSPPSPLPLFFAIFVFVLVNYIIESLKPEPISIQQTTDFSYPQIVQLADYPVYDSSDSDGSAFKAYAVTDSVGIDHGTSLVTQYGNDGYNQYYLDKQYLEFSGKIFLTVSESNTSGENLIEFIGDGNTLATFSFTGGVQPKDFVLDVSYVEVLEIKYSTGAISVGIDATLKKPDPQPEEEAPQENEENPEGEESPKERAE